MKWYENYRMLEPQPKDMDMALSRIIPFDSLLQMLTDEKNTLIRTSFWEDCYENFMLKEEFEMEGLNFSLEGLAKQWYGQCWTTRLSSDAMWRIYSSDKKSVRIKTTVGRLWNSTKGFYGKGMFLMGKVQYFSQSQIQNDLEEGSPYNKNVFIDLINNSFFVKRNSFSHESEYRLIFRCDNDSEVLKKDTISLDINPQDFIMNVFFDPRADHSYMERCKKVLVKAFGYPSNRIHKSQLYEFKPSLIRIVTN